MMSSLPLSPFFILLVAFVSVCITADTTQAPHEPYLVGQWTDSLGVVGLSDGIPASTWLSAPLAGKNQPVKKNSFVAVFSYSYGGKYLVEFRAGATGKLVTSVHLAFDHAKDKTQVCTELFIQECGFGEVFASAVCTSSGHRSVLAFRITLQQNVSLVPVATSLAIPAEHASLQAAQLGKVMQTFSLQAGDRTAFAILAGSTYYVTYSDGKALEAGDKICDAGEELRVISTPTVARPDYAAVGCNKHEKTGDQVSKVYVLEFQVKENHQNVIKTTEQVLQGQGRISAVADVPFTYNPEFVSKLGGTEASLILAFAMATGQTIGIELVDARSSKTLKAFSTKLTKVIQLVASHNTLVATGEAWISGFLADGTQKFETDLDYHLRGKDIGICIKNPRLQNGELILLETPKGPRTGNVKFAVYDLVNEKLLWTRQTREILSVSSFFFFYPNFPYNSSSIQFNTKKEVIMVGSAHKPSQFSVEATSGEDIKVITDGALDSSDVPTTVYNVVLPGATEPKIYMEIISNLDSRLILFDLHAGLQLSVSHTQISTQIFTVQDGVVFGYTNGNVLFAADRNANLLWSLDLNSELKMDNINTPFTILTSGVAVLDTFDTYQFINLLNGNVLTSLRSEDHLCRSEPGQYIAGGFVYDERMNTVNFVTNGGCLVSLEMNLNVATSFEMFSVGSQILKIGSKLRIVHGTDTYYVFSSNQLRTIDVFVKSSAKKQEMQRVWGVSNSDLANTFIPFGKDNQYVMVHTTVGDPGVTRIACHNISSGKVLWSFDTEEKYGASFYPGGEDIFMLGARDTSLAKVSLLWGKHDDPKSILQRSTLQALDVVIAPSGDLYAAHEDGHLVSAVDSETLEPVWTIDIRSEFGRGIAVSKLSFDPENYILFANGGIVTFVIDAIKGIVMRTLVEAQVFRYATRITKWDKDAHTSSMYGFTFLSDDQGMGRMILTPTLISTSLSTPLPITYSVLRDPPKGYVPKVWKIQQNVSYPSTQLPSVASLSAAKAMNAFFYPDGYVGTLQYVRTAINAEGKCIIEMVSFMTFQSVLFTLSNETIPSSCHCEGKIFPITSPAREEVLMLVCELPPVNDRKQTIIAVGLTQKSILWSKSSTKLDVEKSEAFFQIAYSGAMIIFSQFSLIGGAYTCEGFSVVSGADMFAFSDSPVGVGSIVGPPGIYTSTNGMITFMIQGLFSFQFQEIVETGGLGSSWEVSYDAIKCDSPIVPYNGMTLEDAYDHIADEYFYWMCPNEHSNGKTNMYQSTLNKNMTTMLYFSVDNGVEKNFTGAIIVPDSGTTAFFIATGTAIYKWDETNKLVVLAAKGDKIGTMTVQQFVPSMTYAAVTKEVVVRVVSTLLDEGLVVLFSNTTKYSITFSIKSDLTQQHVTHSKLHAKWASLMLCVSFGFGLTRNLICASTVGTSLPPITLLHTVVGVKTSRSALSFGVSLGLYYTNTPPMVQYYSDAASAVEQRLFSVGAGFNLQVPKSRIAPTVLSYTIFQGVNYFVVAGDNAVYSYSDVSGEVRWTLSTAQASIYHVKSHPRSDDQYVLIDSLYGISLVHVATGKSVFGTLSTVHFGDCSLSMQDTTVFFSTDDEILYALAGTQCILRVDINGALMFQNGTNLEDPMVFENIEDYKQVIHHGDTLYLQSSSQLAAFDLKTFKPLWKRMLLHECFSNDQNPLLVVPNGEVLVVSCPEALLLVAASTGKVFSRYDFSSDNQKNGNLMLDFGPLGNSYGYIYTEKGLLKLNLSSPMVEVVWEWNTTKAVEVTIVPSGIFLHGFGSRTLLNRTNGDIIFDNPAEFNSLTVFPEGDAYVADMQLILISTGERLLTYLSPGTGLFRFDSNFPPTYFTNVRTNDIFPISYPSFSIPPGTVGPVFPVPDKDIQESKFVGKSITERVLSFSSGFRVHAKRSIVHAGKLYLRTQDGITHVNLDEGATVANGISIDYKSSSILNARMVVAGRVLVASADGNTFLVGVDLDLEEVLWKVPRPLCQHTLAVDSIDLELLPSNDGSQIFISTEKCIHKMDVATHSIQTVFTSSNPNDRFIGFPAISIFYLIALSETGILSIFDIDNGKFITAVPFGYIVASGGISSVDVYFHGASLAIAAFPGEVFGVEVPKGNIIWRRRLAGFGSSIARYLYSATDILIADTYGVERFNVDTSITDFNRRTQWKTELPLTVPVGTTGGVVLSVAASSDGNVICGFGDSVFVLDGVKGTIINSTVESGASVSIATIRNDQGSILWPQLFLVSYGGQIKAFVAATLQPTSFSLNIQNYMPQVEQRLSALVAQEDTTVVVSFISREQLSNVPGISHTPKLLSEVEASTSAVSSVHLPQNTPTPAPTFRTNSNIPDLGCVINVEAQYNAFITATLQIQSQLYPDALVRNPTNCVAASKVILQVFDRWMEILTAKNCVYSTYLIRNLLTNLVLHSPPFQLCNKSSHCSDGSKGSAAVCDAIQNIVSTVGSGTAEPGFTFPNVDDHVLLTFPPDEYKNSVDNQLGGRKKKTVGIVVGVLSVAVLGAVVTVLILRYRKLHRGRRGESIALVDGAFEMSSSNLN